MNSQTIDFLMAWTIFLGFNFLIILAFRYCLRKSENTRDEGVVVVCGAAAGAAANYFSSLALAQLVSGYYIYAIFSGLIFAIPAGMFLTLVFRLAITKLKLRAGFWSRAAFGLAIGALVGGALGWLLVGDCVKLNENCFTQLWINLNILVYVIFCSSISAASAIMAGRGKLD